MKLNTNNTTSRLILAPVALLAMVLVWMLAGWELGLGAAWLVVYLSPELMMIFSKRWRVLKAKAEREEEEYRRELLEEIERKYRNVELPDDLLRTPMDESDREFNRIFGIKPPSRLV